MEIKWEDGAVIRVRTNGETVQLSANREGLLSLAGILKTLAEETVGSHLHLDEDNSLDEGSAEFIMEKTE